MFIIFSIILTIFCVFATTAIAETAEEWNDKGIELGKSGEYEEAIKAFYKALEINPNEELLAEINR